MIRFHHVYKSFGDKAVLKDISLHIQRGEITFIIGRSGVGKSVLMKVLLGFLTVDQGSIFIDDQEITGLSERAFQEIRKRCVMVFQHSGLFDSMTVLDNVALPLRKHQKLSVQRAQTQAMNYLEQLGLKSFAHHLPAELGDGMRKKVAIARALTLKPEYIILDEPTTSVDPISARIVDQVMRTLSQSLGVTVLVISHDLVSIQNAADHIVFLHEGEIYLQGCWKDFATHRDPVIHAFFHPYTNFDP